MGCAPRERKKRVNVNADVLLKSGGFLGVKLADIWRSSSMNSINLTPGTSARLVVPARSDNLDPLNSRRR